MIKSSELRLGNLVHRVTKSKSWYGPDIERVERITGDYFYGDLPSSQCEPIPLTSEWIERLGLILEGVGKYALYHKGVPILGYWTVDGAVNVGHFIPMYIEYVHQLQNLYFALTGSELQLKDKTL